MSPSTCPIRLLLIQHRGWEERNATFHGSESSAAEVAMCGDGISEPPSLANTIGAFIETIIQHLGAMHLEVMGTQDYHCNDETLFERESLPSSHGVASAQTRRLNTAALTSTTKPSRSSWPPVCSATHCQTAACPAPRPHCIGPPWSPPINLRIQPIRDSP